MKDYSRRIEGVENMEFTGRLSKSIVLEACKKVENNTKTVLVTNRSNEPMYTIFGNIIITGKTERNSFVIIRYMNSKKLFVQGWFRSYEYENGKVEVTG